MVILNKNVECINLKCCFIRKLWSSALKSSCFPRYIVYPKQKKTRCKFIDLYHFLTHLSKFSNAAKVVGIVYSCIIVVFISDWQGNIFFVFQKYAWSCYDSLAGDSLISNLFNWEKLQSSTSFQMMPGTWKWD